MSLNFLTKKIIFLLHLLSVLALVFFAYGNGGETFCGNSWECNELITSIAFVFLAASILLIPSLATFPLKGQAFVDWKRFAVFAIPVVIALTIYLINLDVSDAMGGLLVGQLILMALVGLYALYFLISFCIIGYAWWKSR
ncbi:hypothetical protein C4568_01895 [Candidatus Parcubacteria bacterium]|nr:MAG: hypothetical protein C4568_01895 [Candidatus Parcubacteria bacterium]